MNKIETNDYFDEQNSNFKFRENNPDVLSKTKQTFGYIIAYMTMFYFDISRLQWQKMPTAWSMYYQEKIWCFISEIDNIWWDNFKSILKTISLNDMIESYYLWIWLWWVPQLDKINFDNFNSYMDWNIDKEEFYKFLDFNGK